MADDLDNTIAQSAQAPASMTLDGETVTQQKLTDVIAADRYLRSKQAMKAGRGFRISKMIPHGTQ